MAINNLKGCWVKYFPPQNNISETETKYFVLKNYTTLLNVNIVNMVYSIAHNQNYTHSF